MKNKFILLWAAALCLLAARSNALTFDLSAVKAWAGEGENEAVLVIDWHDGLTPTALAWGFRWDGEATVESMLHAIDAFDPALSFTPHPLYADTVYSIHYDLNANGGTFTLGLPFNMGGTENGSASDPGDHYREGWFTGFWGLLNGNGNPYDGGSWSESEYGMASDSLASGGFYAFSFSTNMVTYAIPPAGIPTAALVVPEPPAASLAALGLGIAAAWRLRGRGRRTGPDPS